jgi:cytochrome c oxidase assembly factor CtaG
MPEDLWQSWSWEPFVLLGLLISAGLYAQGVRLLWRRVGPGRAVTYWQLLAFSLGLGTVFVALISPLNAVSRALFSAHMIQHLLLIVVAAPLLVLGDPLVPLLWGLPKKARHAVGGWWKSAGLLRSAWHGLSQPLVVWSLYTVSLWVWHLPALYQAAIERVFVHELEHLSFLGTALLFWWIVIQPSGHRRLGHGAAILFVFTTALHSGALGALLTFARTPLYPVYSSTVAAWNLTILGDQQLAGLIMWVPTGIVYLLTALILLVFWLQAIERRQAQRERVALG